MIISRSHDRTNRCRSLWKSLPRKLATGKNKKRQEGRPLGVFVNSWGASISRFPARLPVHNPFPNHSLCFRFRKCLNRSELAIPVWFGGSMNQRSTEKKTTETARQTVSKESATRQRERGLLSADGRGRSRGRGPNVTRKPDLGTVVSVCKKEAILQATKAFEIIPR